MWDNLQGQNGGPERDLVSANIHNRHVDHVQALSENQAQVRALIAQIHTQLTALNGVQPRSWYNPRRITSDDPAQQALNDVKAAWSGQQGQQGIKHQIETSRAVQNLTQAINLTHRAARQARVPGFVDQVQQQQYQVIDGVENAEHNEHHA